MISNDRSKYRSSSEWLSALRQDEAWLLQEERLLSADSSEKDALRSKAVERMSDETVSDFWEIYNHNVEKTVQEAWDTGLSLPNLKRQALGLLTLEWLGRHEGAADVDTHTAEPQELNFFAPKKNLQELLKQAWFADVRTDVKYDARWTDSFVEALMASEYGEGIARQWAVKGVRNKRNQLKAYVVGLLKDTGVLKGSYDAIATMIDPNDKKRTLATNMSRGKKQPYADWVKGYVPMPVLGSDDEKLLEKC
ncbi:MAG: hypothetical protein IJ647_10815 [Prevotella sp.]|nr:hypothetical protein [Prevotella sp.]